MRSGAPASRAPSRRKAKAEAVAAAAAAAVALWLGPVPVVVTNVTRSSIPVYLNGLGNVTAFYTVTVKSRVDGQLMKVDFNEGDLVKEGQVLAEIDPRPYQVQLDMAEATLAHDQALLDNAKVDLERYTELLADGRHSEPATGYAERAGGAVRRHHQAGSGQHRKRQAAIDLCQGHGARSRASWACAWWIPATSSTPPTRTA